MRNGNMRQTGATATAGGDGDGYDGQYDGKRTATATERQTAGATGATDSAVANK